MSGEIYGVPAPFSHLPQAKGTPVSWWVPLVKRTGLFPGSLKNRRVSNFVS
jgi:hypothetical protein